MGVTENRYDVIVVGGGQAGLAMGYFLARQGRDFTILEAGEEPAAAWRGRWDSLKLFTPAKYSALPGLAFPGEPWSYPGRDDVVNYLEDYARHFELPVELDSRVKTIRRSDDGYVLDLADRTYAAEQVVIATGPFQMPLVPAMSERLNPLVTQFHSTAYRTPTDVPEGPVLLVGGGNTGFQIAAELSTSHDVHLSIGSRQKPLPQRILGRDLFWFLDKSGLIRKDKQTRIGKRMSETDTLVGSRPRTLARKCGVQLHSRALSADGSTVTFDDGTTLGVGVVIWTTGFRSDYSWIDVPVFDTSGRPVHQRGVTEAPGFYFLGLTWQHTRGSALIGWVKDDAEFIANRIVASPDTQAEHSAERFSSSAVESSR